MEDPPEQGQDRAKPRSASRAGREAEHDRGWKNHWLLEANWTATELATLCCGYDPSSEQLPRREDFTKALEQIIRAVDVGDLTPTAPASSVERHRFYKGHPYQFEPDDDDASVAGALAAAPPVVFEARGTTAWAAKRFAGFPFSPSDWPSTIAHRTPTGLGQDGASDPPGHPAKSPLARPTRALGRILQEHRAQCSLTVEALAHKVGLDPSNVKRHLGGHTWPRPKGLRAYVSVFNEILQPTPRLTVEDLLLRARREHAERTAGT